MNSNNDFNLASEGTQKQKWEFEDRERTKRISQIQSPESRQMMRHNVARRDDYLEAMEKRQALERERMAQDIITGRVPPAPNSNLTPQGGTGLSPEAKERLIRQRVHATLQPIHEKELEKARIDTNRDLDKDLSDIERDEGRSQSTSVSATEAEKRIQQAKDTLQRMRENGREITRGAGRGRSR